MSIHDQAQQLAALAERLPVGQVQAMHAELTAILQQTVAHLGDTASAAAVHSVIAQAQALANDLSAALEHARAEIITAANHHLRG
ncbi:hypothetical protein [Actinokineospora sp.]|uniref:hypothetical protein n=1 Tax=Actinokineospora sp. TaxID=1872133 RepID=UPI0040384CF7